MKSDFLPVSEETKKIRCSQPGCDTIVRVNIAHDGISFCTEHLESGLTALTEYRELENEFGESFNPAPVRHVPTFDEIDFFNFTPKEDKAISLQGEIKSVKLDRLSLDPNIRADLGTEESLLQLGYSLKQHGQQQPILVRRDISVPKNRQARYFVIDGQRRYKAALAVGLESLSCSVMKQDIDGVQRVVQQFAANEFRKDMTFAEKSQAIQKLHRAGMSLKEIMEETLVKKAHLDIYLKIKEMSPSIKDLIEKGEIKYVHAVSQLQRLTIEEQEDIAEQYMDDKAEHDLDMFYSVPQLKRKIRALRGKPEIAELTPVLGWGESKEDRVKKRVEKKAKRPKGLGRFCSIEQDNTFYAIRVLDSDRVEILVNGNRVAVVLNTGVVELECDLPKIKEDQIAY